ncbi:TIR domain-containing protein [Baaleninema simplex]|uniref:TIR domain-containing protein n=1 Tax=Baaleninema simplex TaxID=2862350 RepID=UPI000345C348|nr:TIR domain-containing protein [Baaleninema simplex]
MQGFQDIFISYGRRDSLEFASRLNRYLIDRGFRVWFDFDDIPLGVDYQKQIDDGIERADNFLFVISPHSINSPYCGLELELALKHQKRIVPWLHVEKISYETWQQRNPNGTEEEWADYQAKGLHDHFQNMHPTLRKINWIYGREEQDDFEAAFTGLLDILDRHHDYVHQHTVLLVKALEWERHQKRSPYLLIGEERLEAQAWLEVRFKDSQPPCIPTDLHCEFVTESRKNSENSMTDVFLAYTDENRETAARVCCYLRREGFTVWTNRTDIHAGVEFQQAIDRGIEEADNVVYLLSSASVRSPHCQHELEYALSLNKRIVPVSIEAIPSDRIPLALQNSQYVDLTDNRRESDPYERLVESPLLQVLRRDAAYHTTHKRLLTKALKWERQNRNPTLLLRGYNLRQAEAWLKLTEQIPAYSALPLQQAFIEESLRQPPGISLDVFISYSRADAGFARKLNDALQIQGKRTWFDQESIAAGTADFQQEIHRGIENADIFLFVLSPRSVTSPYCADEVEYAARLNKRFVTLLHQPIDPSTLHPELAKVQWLDFHQSEDDFSANFTELLRILDTDTEHLHTHTRLLVRAIEWDEKGRKESLLLRGDDLEQAEQWLSQCVAKEPQPTELQQSYIASSRSVEDANQQAIQILKSATTKAKRLVWIAGGVSLLIAGVAGFAAVKARTLINVAEMRLKIATANEEHLSGQQFQALLTTLEASKALRTQFRENSSEWKALQPRIMGTLQQVKNEIREKNTLEGHRSVVTSVNFSPNGKILASGSGDNTIKLWNVETGEEIRTLERHKAEVFSTHFSPDGKILASGSSDNTIKLWDVETGEEIRTLDGHQNVVSSISFSSDGKILASGGWDNTVKLWSVETGKEIRTLEGHQNWVDSINFSPNGKILASSGSDKTIKLWDVESGEEIRTLEGHQSRVKSLDFSPDEKILASGSFDKTIKLWNIETGEELRTFNGHKNKVFSINFSPTGKTLISGSSDNTIKLWDVESSEEIFTLEGHQSSVNSLSFSPDGQIIASGSEDNTIKLWNLEVGEEVRTLEEHQSFVSSLDFTPDGKTLASGGNDNTIALWNVEFGEKIRTLEGYQSFVNTLHFSPDGNTLAFGSDRNTIKLWDVEASEEIITLEGHLDRLTSLDFHYNKKMLASGSDDKTIKLWNVETGEEIRTLEGHQDTVFSISFSPNGKILASGSNDKTIKLWNVETGKEIRTLEGHQDAVFSISFSPNGKILASGSNDKTIKLWNVETGKEIRTLEGHYSEVWSVSFSPNGQIVASGHTDNTIKLWQAETGELLHTLQGHQNPIWRVSFSPDGKTIASGSQDTTVKLWVWDFDRLMTTSCDWIQDYLMTRPNERVLCEGYLPQL